MERLQRTAVKRNNSEYTKAQKGKKNENKKIFGVNPCYLILTL